MRRFPLSLCAALLVALAMVSPAHATHVTLRPVGVDTLGAAPKINLAKCLDRTTQYSFVWTVAVSSILPRNNLDIQLRATTDKVSSCTFAGTEDCIELVTRQRWSAASPYRIDFTFAQLFPEGCAGTGKRQVTLFVKDNDQNLLTGMTEEAFRGDIELSYDFDRPTAPASAPTVHTGDAGLNVTWAGVGSDAGATTYRVYWATDAAKLVGSPSCGSDFTTGCVASNAMTATTFRISGLTDGQRVYVAYSQLDDFDNEGPLSPTASGIPEKINDFFQYYAAQGGQEKGGFCFIATAAYGSYWHPLVGSLRKFRDTVLLQSELGRDFVSFYYSWSPAMAEVIDDTPWLRFFFKVALAPVAVAAWFVVDTTWWQKILLLALAWLALRLGRRLLRGLWKGGLGRQRTLFVALLAIGLLVTAPAAFAESPRNFYIELKVGSLAPSMDARGGAVGLAQPFTKIFGDASRVVSGFEFEWQILKDVGSFGVSGAMLYFQAVGKGVLAATGETSPETTVLNVLPLQLNAVYRFDIPMRKYNVPLVPYAKAGLDWYLWWVLNGAGNVSSFTDGGGAKRRGVGGTWGVHFSLGIQFQLDIIDRRMQKSFDEEVGVNHSYLFAEVVFSKVDDFNDRSFNFGSTYFLAGLALEF